MGIGEFFKALIGGQPPHATGRTQEYVEWQGGKARGQLGASHRRVAVMTLSDDLRFHLAEQLEPIVEAKGYTYEDRPSLDEATGSQIVILDGSPQADARLHGKYDKILRVKKSMGKVQDVLCIIGRREDFRRYPRGTYPNLLYFCMKEGEFEHREPDMPSEGTDTVEGPRLYNLADLPAAIARKIRELSGSPGSTG